MIKSLIQSLEIVREQVPIISFYPGYMEIVLIHFFYSGIKNWNSLPAEIKQTDNESTFKDKVKRNIEFEARNTESCPFLFFS